MEISWSSSRKKAIFCILGRTTPETSACWTTGWMSALL